MSKAGSGEGPAEAVEEAFTRLLNRAVTEPFPLVPADLLQAAALALIRQRPIPASERDAFEARATPLLRRALSRWARDTGIDLALMAGLALPVSALQLDAALTRLEAADPDLARLAEARCYGGIEAADPARWRIARAWLQDALTAPEEAR